MASKVEICNLALSHLGQGKEIANLETENSAAAAACRRFYEPVRKSMLRDFHWPFASKFRTLSLIEEDPNEEWRYSYRYPTDCVNAVRILSGERVDTPDTRVAFKISQDSGGFIILTDQQDAVLEYTSDVVNPALFTYDFVIAFSYRFASYIGPRVAGADPLKLADKAWNKYLFELTLAQANAGKEEQLDQQRESEFVRSRE